MTSQRSHWIVRSRHERLAFALHRSTVIGCLISLAVLLLLFGIYLCLGSSYLSPADVAGAIWQPDTSEHRFVVQTLRLPRALLALMVGAGLGVSGAILQRLVRNPLASPDIVGVTDGAAVAAVLFLAWGTALSLDWLPPLAIAGALLSSGLIYALAWRGGVLPIRLVLVGIALAAALKAITTLVLVMSPLSTTVRAYVWLTGSLYGAQWQDVWGLLPWTAILLPATWLLARPLSVLTLTDSQAVGLGLAVNRYRLLLLLCSVGLAGSAVAFAGGIGFVGLLAPHLARGLTGRTLNGQLFGSACTGAALVLVADLIGRTLFLPQDLPAGIFVSAVGAPFFIYLLYRRRH
ncbi:FecCD family ABC transporter permease [Saccharospirillum mangrovi]|uniref:FecCD family ABC transporter permease n=1 Tax=Saccharospirillum mangrovi TaxID=2161747 RepID=UPI000D3965D8|nr:iron ABC transporter permease [Saccharospirillum mangrovi]